MLAPLLQILWPSSSQFQRFHHRSYGQISWSLLSGEVPQGQRPTFHGAANTRLISAKMIIIGLANRLLLYSHNLTCDQGILLYSHADINSLTVRSALLIISISFLNVPYVPEHIIFMCFLRLPDVSQVTKSFYLPLSAILVRLDSTKQLCCAALHAHSRPSCPLCAEPSIRSPVQFPLGSGDSEPNITRPRPFLSSMTGMRLHMISAMDTI